MTNKTFKRVILFLLLLLPFLSIISKERLEKGLIEMYAEEDLSNTSLYLGGFSNFGYWEHIDLKKINDKARIESQKNLYRYILDHLELYNDDKVLEVGSGKGLAAQIIDAEYASDTYIGMDLSSHQIKQAKKLNHDLLKSEKTYRYLVGQAEKMPFDNQSFSKLFSVEAAQHFYPFESFVRETDRILKQNGKIVIATTFAKNSQSIPKLKAYIQTIDKNINLIIPIDEAHKFLKNQGFVDIHIEPIGQYVFEGFDKWVGQTKYKDSFRRNWKKAYDEGLVDYYVISAYKPVELIRM